ncbi:MAG: sulfate adenylyltransferase, partial [Deltaproteobacteria bacterium]|nr:sulfate adenylyltransferase [Deltaproteobacteria bacterium]
SSDLVMLAMGAFSPLDGFMRRDDYLGSVREMRMADGVLWPIPITLAVTTEVASGLRTGQQVALEDAETGALMALMTLEELYAYDKGLECREVFRTEDPAHPGVAKVLAQGDVLLGGPVQVLDEGPWPGEYGPHYLRPAESRAIFQEKGWRTVAAFQTRNPIHRSHEYCTKIALEVTDGLFVHPLVGKLKAGDIPADVRMECYKVLLDNYYPVSRVVLGVYPLEMRYAGPREAVLHAVFRQNYGCSHLIVGRDHAGVGSYYGPFDAQKIFTELRPGDLHLQPLNIDWTFHCYRCGGMASPKTCPHGREHHLNISGTALREMLARGEKPSEDFSRPEVLDVLIRYYQSL